MDTPAPGLPFEEPIFELEMKIQELQKSEGEQDAEAIRQLQRELKEVCRSKQFRRGKIQRQGRDEPRLC